MTHLKSIPWRLAEFSYNRGLQETINGFLCPVIAFLKSEAHQLNFDGRDDIE